MPGWNNGVEIPVALMSGLWAKAGGLRQGQTDVLMLEVYAACTGTGRRSSASGMLNSRASLLLLVLSVRLSYFTRCLIPLLAWALWIPVLPVAS